MSNGRPIGPDERARIERMYVAGCRYRDIATETERHIGTIAGVIAAATDAGRIKLRGCGGNPHATRRGKTIRAAITRAAPHGLQPGMAVPHAARIARALGISTQRAARHRQTAMREAGIVAQQCRSGLVVFEVR